MKKIAVVFFGTFLGMACAAQAVTFTSDTLIDFNDVTYDGQDVVVNGCTLTVNGVHEFSSLQVISSGVLTHSAAGFGQPDYKMNLAVAGDVYVEAGSEIAADGQGYLSASGPGAGRSGNPNYGGGAGHGGAGGRASSGTPGGMCYGSAMGPADFGSGGGDHSSSSGSGGPGGGAIRLTVAGTLRVNGILSANGADYKRSYAGGGAGGSVYLTVGTLAGTGSISASGGDGHRSHGGGGGGGRIAIYCRDTVRFTLGNISVDGGLGFAVGRPGTLWLIEPDSAPMITSVIPTGVVNTAIDHVDVGFTWQIDPNTLDVDAVQLMGPEGEVAISDVVLQSEVLGRQTYRMDFASQASDGVYHVLIDPDVTGINGKFLDQDRDGVGGESSDDRYEHEFQIDRTGPSAARHVIVGDVGREQKYIYLWFSEPVNVETFSADDITVRASDGIQDNVTPVTISQLASRWFRITLESLDGVNDVLIGPQIEDVVGNAMDQNQNGVKGEDSDDCYSIGVSSADVVYQNILTVDDDGPADFRSIQTAIDSATHGDIISVYPGVYRENINYAGKQLTVQAAPTINAGFDPISSQMGSPGDPTPGSSSDLAGQGLNAVIISGNGGDGVTFNSGEDANAVLDGITVTNSRYGIYCSQASPTIRNCCVVGSTSHGLYCQKSPNIEIADCMFVDNSDSGLLCESSPSAHITACTLSENSDYGLFCSGSPAVVIDNCLLSNNAKTGLHLASCASAAITECTVIGNKADGIYCNNCSDLVISDCLVCENSGHGVYCRSSSEATIAGCMIVGNAKVPERYGLYCYASSPHVAHCVIAGNEGYGVFCDKDASPSIANCTVADNSNRGISGTAGEILNCIIWDNADDLYGCSATYSCIENGDTGPGNIAYSPYFVDATGGDYHLLSFSPCVDAGDPTSDASLEPGDGEGRINMGAYGNTPEAARASLDADNDDLPDAWELVHWPADVNLSQGPHDDPDNDGLPNIAEYQMQCDPAVISEKVRNDTTQFLYNNLQIAIALAQSGDTLIVYPGTYFGRIKFNGKRIHLRSLDPTDPQVVASTVIESYGEDGVTFNTGEDASTILDGFTIRNSRYGVYCSGSSPTIKNCLITNSTSHGFYGVDSSATLTGCIITRNASYGIYCKNSPSTRVADSQITHNAGPGLCFETCPSSSIMRSAFTDNGGQGVYCRFSPDLTVDHCTILNNEAGADNSGGLYCRDSSSAVITDCTIEGNSGHGLYCRASSETEISHCDIASNSGMGLQCGGSAQVEVRHCRIEANLSYGAYYVNASEAVMAHCVIVANAGAKDTAGLYCNKSSPRVEHCVLAANQNHGVLCANTAAPSFANCTIANNAGAGVHGSEGTIANCILWDNDDDLYGCSATHSCVEDGDRGLGNIAGYPYFVDAANADYHLLRFSPCIDTGDVNSEFSLEPGDGGGRINMGAYGNTQEAALACQDVDGDGLPDDWELLHWPDDRALSQAPAEDVDGDALENIVEYQIGWSPNLKEAFTGSITNRASSLNYPSISKAIAFACDGDEVVVGEGTYYERVDLHGKSITLRSTDPDNAARVTRTVIDPNGGDGVTCTSGEDANTVLNGFTIVNARYGIWCLASSPTVRNCVLTHATSHGLYCETSASEVVGCTATRNALCGIVCKTSPELAVVNCRLTDNGQYGVRCVDSSSLVTHSVIAHNGSYGVHCTRSSPFLQNCTILNNIQRGLSGAGDQVTNCILWGNDDDLYASSATFSCIGDGDEGLGNISIPPIFVDSNNLDYHLAPNSVCIDAGAPWSEYGREPTPNGSRINMGAYGNTPEAAITVDTDGDTLPDAWERAWWPEDPNLSYGPDDNPDGDDFSVRAEYLFGYDPTVVTDEPMQIVPVQRPFRGGPIQIVGVEKPLIELDPTNHDMAVMSYALTMDGQAAIAITHSVTRDTVYELTQTVTAGVSQVCWNGVDANAIIAADGFYDVTIAAQHDAHSTVWTSQGGAPTAPATKESTNAIDLSDFDPHQNKPARIDFDMTDWGTLLIEARRPGQQACLIMNNDRILSPGHHTCYWNGRGGDGRIVDGIFDVYFGVPQGIHVGVILIQSVPPQVTRLLCNAYRIVSSYNEISVITYELTEDALVTVDIEEPDGNYCRTLLDHSLQTAGPQQVLWDGRNDEGECMFVEGVYRVKIVAEEPHHPGIGSTAVGAITVYR